MKLYLSVSKTRLKMYLKKTPINSGGKNIYFRWEYLFTFAFYMMKNPLPAALFLLN